MSIESDEPELTADGAPELTELGKRLELLRIDRRMSKSRLAVRAGISRQQLWRVMTGKSELTSSLCARLSEVLETDSRSLRAFASDDAGRLGPREPRICQTLDDYISSPDGLAHTFSTLPPTRDGRQLKRALLDAIEEIAMSRSLELPQAIFDLRRAVVNDAGLTTESAPPAS